MIRRFVQQVLGKFPRANGLLRRHLWSRVHFPEAELRLLAALPPHSFDCAVDVGAALGSYAWVLGRKSRHVVAYEPGTSNGDYLEIATRGSNITLVRGAVGSAAGELELFTAAEAGAAFTATLNRHNPVAKGAGVHRQKVPVYSLDDDLPRHIGSNASIDFIKIDVEGYENAVIAGAAATIARFSPIIVCEIEVRHNADYGYVFDTLRELGYKVFFWRSGKWCEFNDGAIDFLQNPSDFERRIKVGGDAEENSYINNFLFQHPRSRVKMVPSGIESPL